MWLVCVWVFEEFRHLCLDVRALLFRMIESKNELCFTRIFCARVNSVKSHWHMAKSWIYKWYTHKNPMQSTSVSCSHSAMIGCIQHIRECVCDARTNTRNKEKILTNRAKRQTTTKTTERVLIKLSFEWFDLKIKLSSHLLFSCCVFLFCCSHYSVELFDFEINVFECVTFSEVMLNVYLCRICAVPCRLDWSAVYRMRIYNVVVFSSLRFIVVVVFVVVVALITHSKDFLLKRTCIHAHKHINYRAENDLRNFSKHI